MLVKVPSLLKRCYPNRIWNAPPEGNRLYLSFDDGPIPEVTPWVLEQLQAFGAKATFFCIGDNVRKHPEVFRQVLRAGHSIGNHTFNHLNGWSSPKDQYVNNVLQAEKTIRETAALSTSDERRKLFRPPYGKMTGSQARRLRQFGFEIVMWDILTQDYDARLTPDRIFRSVLKTTRPGSILLFHDSLKAEKNMKAVLPRVLEHYMAQGFRFEGL